MSVAGLYLDTAMSFGVGPGKFLADIAAVMRARMSFRDACNSSLRSGAVLSDTDAVVLIVLIQI